MAVLPNERHELFCQRLADGMNNVDAYQKAGFETNPRAAAASANRLRNNANISRRINEILADREKIHAQSTAKAVQKLSITKEWVLASLVENAQRALQAVPVMVGGEPTGEYKYEGSVANRALELVGKELGMFIDRKETGAPGEFAGLDNPRSLAKAIADRLAMVGSGDEASGMAESQRGSRNQLN